MLNEKTNHEATAPLVPLCSFFWEAGPGEQRWDDLFDCNALQHALPRFHLHSRRRMEDDQNDGAVDVLLLLSFCDSIPCIDIWVGGVPNEYLSPALTRMDGISTCTRTNSEINTDHEDAS